MDQMRVGSFPSPATFMGLSRLSKRDVVALVGSNTIAGAIFSVVLFRQSAHSDFPFHAGLAQRWLETGRPPVSHWLYHALSLVLHALIPSLSVLAAGRAVAISSYVLSGVIAYLLIRPHLGSPEHHRGSLLAACGVVSLQVLAPVTLFTMLQRNLYIGYFPTTVYHNPTIILLRPLALLLFVRALSIFDEVWARSRRPILAAAALVVVSSLAKPSYGICLLPGLLLFCAVRQMKTESVDRRLTLLGFVLPMLLSFAAQYIFTYAQSGGESLGVELAPLYFFQETLRQLHKPVWLLPKLMLSLLFPLCVLCLDPRAAVRRVPLALAWVVFAIGAFYSYFVIESGPGRLDGNFTWSGQISLYVLFAFSLVFFLERVASRKLNAVDIACGIALGLHVLCGMIWACTQARSDSAFWW
jgi:hypothetical protein